MHSTNSRWRVGRAARGLVLGVLVFGTPLTSVSVASAQSQEELDRARTLFRQGLSLEAAGNWAAALGKFQEVGKVKLTPQVRFHIARCKEQLGRLNEALGDYRLAEYEAEQQGLAELSAISEAREQLEARVPKVVISRGEGVESARIELDGVELGEKQIGQPVGVDPGPHSIVVKLSGDLKFSQNVTIQERDTQYIELVVPPELLEASKQVEPVPATDAAKPGDSGAQGGSAANVVPWVVGGVGVASLAASGVFFVLRNKAENDLESGCRGNVCPESLEGTRDKGQLYGTLSPVFLGVGIAGVGVATYWLVSGKSRDAARESARVLVDVAAAEGGGGVAVSGRF